MYSSEFEISENKYSKGSELNKTFKSYAINLIEKIKQNSKFLTLDVELEKTHYLYKKKL